MLELVIVGKVNKFKTKLTIFGIFSHKILIEN